LNLHSVTLPLASAELEPRIFESKIALWNMIRTKDIKDIRTNNNRKGRAKP